MYLMFISQGSDLDEGDNGLVTFNIMGATPADIFTTHNDTLECRTQLPVGIYTIEIQAGNKVPYTSDVQMAVTQHVTLHVQVQHAQCIFII